MKTMDIVVDGENFYQKPKLRKMVESVYDIGRKLKVKAFRKKKT